MTIPDKIGNTPSDFNEAYLPYPVASKKGVPRLNEAKLHHPSEASIAIQNGLMPEQGGLVQIDPVRGIIGAFDLVSAERQGSRLVVKPAKKSAVDNETDKIVDEGLITLSVGESLLKVVGFVEREPLAHKTAIYMLGLEAKLFEIDELEDSGVIIAKIKRNYF